MNRILFSCLFCLAISASILANDSTYYVSGNCLIPLQETDISISEEHLSFTLRDDCFVDVDVSYVFFNPSDKKKNITMGFEAEASSGAYDTIFQPDSGHPYIKDFAVVFNGLALPYTNGIVVNSNHSDSLTVFKPITEFDRYIPFERFDEFGVPFVDESALYDIKNNKMVYYSYAYYFNCVFEPGYNIVKHSYRYRTSHGSSFSFMIPYWLKPAQRWKGGKIDTFTMTVRAENTAKHFCILSEAFSDNDFYILDGDGKTRKTSLYDEHCSEVSLRNGTVACIIKDFEPKYDMEIFSGDYLYRQDDKEYPLGEFYDRKYGLGALERAPNTAEEKRIIRNLPYANRGYVFKDESLRQYFSKIWWYMPDPLWAPSDSDFTDTEHRYIKNASRP